MTRNVDNEERIEYHNGGVKYIIIKTVPPKLITEVDFADARLVGLGATWEHFSKELDRSQYTI